MKLEYISGGFSTKPKQCFFCGGFAIYYMEISSNSMSFRIHMCDECVNDVNIPLKNINKLISKFNSSLSGLDIASILKGVNQ